MQGASKDKIASLLLRSCGSLPCFNDLPRLLKYIQVLEDDNLVVDPRQGGDENLVDLFYSLVSSVAGLLGEEEHNLVNSTFHMFKRKLDDSGEWIKSKLDNDKEHLEQVLDPKLRNAVRYFKSAFVGAEESSKFLFEIDKPSCYILLLIHAKSVQFRVRDTPKKGKVDCKISCSSATLAAIFSGALEFSVALQEKRIIVDNLKKFPLLSKAFHVDRSAFEHWNGETRVRRNSINPSAEEHILFANNLKKYFTEILGEQNPVVKILKACNSATISPAITDLKLSLGMNFMTKDVPGSWKFAVVFLEDMIVIKTRKQELDLKDVFRYEWELALTYSKGMELREVFLEVVDLAFNDTKGTPDELQRKQEVKNILSKFAQQHVIQNSDNQVYQREDLQKSPMVNPLVRKANHRKEIYFSGDSYEGEFNQFGKRHGFGTFTTSVGDIYVGNYVDGIREGHGVITMINGTRYEGEFVAGKPQGRGVCYFDSQDESNGKNMKKATYDGEWKDGKFHGHGIYHHSNNDVYEGQFSAGKFHGMGKYTVAATGKKVEGEFIDGKPKSESADIPIQNPCSLKLDERQQYLERWREEQKKRT